MKNDKARRWTTKEMTVFVAMWQNNAPLEEIAVTLNSTVGAIRKHVVRLRQQGIPLNRRVAGNIAGKYNALWTQGDIEFLMRRRQENATMEQIAVELNRTFSAVQGMIQRLRIEGAGIKMLGAGRKRLWDVGAIRSMVFMDNVVPIDHAKKAA